MLIFYWIIFTLDNGINAQLVFSHELLPEERFPTCFYTWKTAGEGIAYTSWSFPDSTAKWVESISPTNFSSSSCNDVNLINYTLKANSEVGKTFSFYLKNNAGNFGNLTLNMKITNSPKVDSTIYVEGFVNTEDKIDLKLIGEFPGIISCQSQPFETYDSLQSQFFWSPQNGSWINFNKDTIELKNSEIKQKRIILKSSSIGKFETYFIVYREYRSFPKRYKIVYDVKCPNFENDYTVVPSSCFNSNGKISLLNIDTNNYSIKWENGATTTQLNNLTNGIYKVTLSDLNSECEYIESITIINNGVNPIVDLGPDINITQGTEATLDAGAGNDLSYKWSSGETTQTIIVNALGTYSVTVTNAQGCSASDDVMVTVISNTDDQENKPKPYLFPNPTIDLITLKMNGNKFDNYYIIDNLNRILMESKIEKMDNDNLLIDVSKLSIGIYSIKLRDEKKTELLWFVKI